MPHASEPCRFESDEIVGACKFGATSEELQALLGDRLAVFMEWMHEKTMAVCPDHGIVVYRWDLDRFLAGCNY